MAQFVLLTPDELAERDQQRRKPSQPRPPRAGQWISHTAPSPPRTPARRRSSRPPEPVRPAWIKRIDDREHLAGIKVGEVRPLRRPDGEGYAAACMRFERMGARMGIVLRCWWTLSGEQWHVVRLR